MASSHSWEQEPSSTNDAYIVQGSVPEGKGNPAFAQPVYGAYSGKASYKGTEPRQLLAREKDVAREQKFAPSDGDPRTYIWNEKTNRRIGGNGRALNSSPQCRARRFMKRQSERLNDALNGAESADEPDACGGDPPIPDDGAFSPGLITSDMYGYPTTCSVSPGVITPLHYATDAFVPPSVEGSTLTSCATSDGLTSLPRSLIDENDQFTGPSQLQPEVPVEGPHWLPGTNQCWVFDWKKSRLWWKWDGDTQTWFEDVHGDRHVDELTLLLGKVPDAMHLCINRDAAPVTPPRNPLIRGPDLVADMAALSMEEADTTNRKPSKDSCGVPTQDSWEPDIRAQQPPSQPAPEQPPPQPAQPAPQPTGGTPTGANPIGGPSPAEGTRKRTGMSGKPKSGKRPCLGRALLRVPTRKQQRRIAAARRTPCGRPTITASGRQRAG